MANRETAAPVTSEELLISTLAQSDALAKLLIEKGVITQQEFIAKISEERAVYQHSSNPPLTDYVSNADHSPLHPVLQAGPRRAHATCLYRRK